MKTFVENTDSRTSDPHHRLLHVVVLCLLALTPGSLNSCSGDSPTSDAGETPDAEEVPEDTGPWLDGLRPRDDITQAYEIQHWSLTPDPGNALAMHVLWESSVPASSSVYVSCPGGGETTVEEDLLSIQHHVFVFGLVADARCTVVLSGKDAQGNPASLEAPYDVPSIPGFLPPLTTTAEDTENLEPGWTLFNLTNSFDKPPLLIVAVDEAGRYRWVHQRAVQDPGSDTDVRLTDDGILVGGTHGTVWPALIDWRGAVLWEKSIVMHHDFRPSLRAGRWLLLTDVQACGLANTSGAVLEFDRNEDAVTWTWNLCDHYLPEEVVPDWSHLNTASLWPGGEFLLVSSRNQNALFKVAFPSGEILWKLGPNGDFEVDDEAVFYQQHDPECQNNGNILLFDNGLSGVRESSRALELKVDETSMKVEKVWEFTPAPPIFAPIWGDSDRQPNGNTLVVFGQRSTTLPSHVIEVNASGQELWHLTTPPRWGIYRAQRFASPGWKRTL